MLEERPIRQDAEECLAQSDETHDVRHPIGREVVELSPEVGQYIKKEIMDWERQAPVEERCENYPLVGAWGWHLLASLW